MAVLLSTIDCNINKVNKVILNPRSDIIYIISHQYTQECYKYIPKELVRNDVVVSQIKGSGVTKSRNNAMRLASEWIGVFADDDVRYTHEYFNEIIKTFSEEELLDVAIFKIKTPDGYPEYKAYPTKSMKLASLPFSIGTIEIAFKIESIRKKNILFDERFGAGQPLLIGSDESIFIFDCINAGLNVRYYPRYIVEHPFISTAKQIPKYDKRRVSVAGAFDSRVKGWISIPKAILYTIILLPDLFRNKKNPLIYLKERLFASIYILFTNQTK